jgi:hypothetical protein
MTERPDTSPPSSTLSGLLLRTWWMLLGNGALLLVLALMAFERSALPSLLDVAFVALLASLVIARFVDIRYFGGCTAEGARATMTHFRRYVLHLLAGSAAGFGLANAPALL